MPGLVHIRESARAHRARIVVAPYRPIEVVVPAGTPAAWVERFVEQHADWIRQQRSLQLAPQLYVHRPGSAWIDGAPVPAPAGDPVRWYRRRAREAITAAVGREAERLGLHGWSRIRIGDQRTRWGSCSARGTLSFNWRLVMAPAWVREYVVVHELCHLRHLDHSPRFWELLDRACPARRDAQRWLRRLGPELQAYSPAAATET